MGCNLLMNIIIQSGTQQSILAAQIKSSLRPSIGLLDFPIESMHEIWKIKLPSGYLT